MGIEKMENKNIEDLLSKESIEDYAKYLGVDYEDFNQFYYKNRFDESIDFDDCSR